MNNSNRIPLAIQIYSSDNPPKLVEQNLNGKNVLKGKTEKDLVYG